MQMSGVDLIQAQDQFIAHQYRFSLWPQEWKAYNLPDPFNWNRTYAISIGI